MMILASDYDGTFNKLGIPKENIEAVKRFRAQGHLFGFVSGRSLDMMFAEIDLFKIPFDFIIGCNGAIVCDSQRQVESVAYIDSKCANAILKLAKTYKNDFIGVTNGEHYYNLRCSLRNLYNISKSLLFKRMSYNRGYVYKNEQFASIYISGNNISSLYHKILADFKDCAPFMNQKRYIDVAPINISKGKALDDYLKKHQLSDIYCIGDSFNDISMIQKFNGFCVNNADEAIHKIASKSFINVAACIDYLLSK